MITISPGKKKTIKSRSRSTSTWIFQDLPIPYTSAPKPQAHMILHSVTPNAELHHAFLPWRSPSPSTSSFKAPPQTPTRNALHSTRSTPSTRAKHTAPHSTRRSSPVGRFRALRQELRQDQGARVEAHHVAQPELDLEGGAKSGSERGSELARWRGGWVFRGDLCER